MAHPPAVYLIALFLKFFISRPEISPGSVAAADTGLTGSQSARGGEEGETVRDLDLQTSNIKLRPGVLARSGLSPGVQCCDLSSPISDVYLQSE